MSDQTHRPERGDDAPLNLRRERSCINDLLWRCELPEEVDLERLPEALERRECREKDDQGVLPMWVYFTPGDHRIMIVPRTGRIQLRLHYEEPEDRRVQTAVDLAELLEEACREVSPAA